jgi:hypothetical protein
LDVLRSQIDRSARDKLLTIPQGRMVDLVQAFAASWSLGLACMVTGAADDANGRLEKLARTVFLSAARATDSALSPEALAATAELARNLPSAGGFAKVQAFLAITQTLPCFLAAAWLALLRHPDECEQLRHHPERIPKAVDELLRYSGPSRAVFRFATAAVQVGNAQINRGQRAVLLLDAANHDPAQFPDPDRLRLDRTAAGHLAFGGGAHSCSGAALIRMAVAVATGALLEAARSIEIAGEVEWIGGFAIRGPASLPVVLYR